MTSWQDQQDRGAPRPPLNAANAQPTSRRAAREAERRAAEALQERLPHPSGVVDFDPAPAGPGFAPDQDFHVGDTQDIWAALTRGSQSTGADTGSLRRVAPEARPASEGSPVSGELLDRVRDAVLRRQDVAPAAEPIADPGASRRSRRAREADTAREDGLPTELFDGRARAASAFPSAYQQPAVWAEPPAYADPSAYAEPAAYQHPQPAADLDGYARRATPQGYEEYDEDDGYYDEPYAPEPTIAVAALRPMELEPAPTSASTPIGLPHSFVQPVGDDALTFSSPVPVVPAAPVDRRGPAAADTAFHEPEDEWEDDEEPWEPQSAVAVPKPAQPRSPFLEPQPDAFHNRQLGPPSEVTDLAGFEALIRKARQQPTTPPESQPAVAWADDEEVQEGFTGLLSRSVQGSHGSANALILPTDPQPDLVNAISGSGDIFVTGSMNLPRSLSTTGTTSEHDSRDIDRLFEAAQDEPAAGVAPVRASRAISGDAQARVLVGARRGRGNVVPTVLAIVAGVMAVGVVGLLVASWASQLF